MDPLFPEFGIYSAVGQRYRPVDARLMLSYREALDGQILEEGISEAGAVAAFQAAGTSYATFGIPMVPIYLFYSMFGFQRTGDAIWQLGDARARGFLLGGTAGRTTLLGEGLQHQDGHSHLLAAAYPFIRAWDPAFAYEVAAIMRHGLAEMYGEDPQDVIHYLTLSNEPLPQPARGTVDPKAIISGVYRYREAGAGPKRATMLFSGSIVREALAAAKILERDHGVGVDLYSVTSYKALRSEALEAKAHHRTPHVTSVLEGAEGPIIAVSDYVTLVPDQVAPFIGRPMTVLGTDGVGMSDSREALRAHFGVDADSIVERTLLELTVSESGAPFS
jgi:pyruvate dehydrogenase E1 component